MSQAPWSAHLFGILQPGPTTSKLPEEVQKQKEKAPNRKRPIQCGAHHYASYRFAHAAWWSDTLLNWPKEEHKAKKRKKQQIRVEAPILKYAWTTPFRGPYPVGPFSQIWEMRPPLWRRMPPTKPGRRLPKCPITMGPQTWDDQRTPTSYRAPTTANGPFGKPH